MSQLRKQLQQLLPRFAKEANKITDEEARSRWMRIRSITNSPKSLAQACRFYGMSEDCYSKWGNRILANPVVTSLISRSRKPLRSPRRTKARLEKQVLKVRRVEPYLGPQRISDTLKRVYNLIVPPSTVFAILRRARVVGKKIAQRLTKKHLRRYRRELPGYLQMDFKYVPYSVDGRQLYQLSCVDHHSSWRLIRIYRYKNMESVLCFLDELKEVCPFGIVEIQTDNDSAFTDKFTSGYGVTGQHPMDLWCQRNEINHRLIPVGIKELNGKVENTHKQDDREFYAVNAFNRFQSIELSVRGYNDRWNRLRATKALSWKTPEEVINAAYIKVLAFILHFRSMATIGHHKLDNEGNAYMPIPKPKKTKIAKTRTRKPSSLETYLKYLDWADKKKLPAVLTYPTMSQICSGP